MAKPFRVTTPAPVEIVRLPNGQFAKGDQPMAPPQFVDRAREQGQPITEVLEEGVRADLSTGEILWGPAGPVNDAGQAPMRLKPGR